VEPPDDCGGLTVYGRQVATRSCGTGESLRQDR
jgi:hypothetical protein